MFKRQLEEQSSFVITKADYSYTISVSKIKLTRTIKFVNRYKTSYI